MCPSDPFEVAFVVIATLTLVFVLATVSLYLSIVLRRSYNEEDRD